MRNAVLFLMLTVVNFLGHLHAQQVEQAREIRGNVEQWAPSGRIIKVGGETFTLAKDVQIMDSNTALLKGDRVRLGGTVLLLVAHGEVSHVVINPPVGSVMDQPLK